jgi:hypothetical protein
MRAKLIRHDKVIDELGNTVEIKMWKLPKATKDKRMDITGLSVSESWLMTFTEILEDIREVNYESKENKDRH